jgi:hypothetical protein
MTETEVEIKLHEAYQPLWRERHKRYFLLTGGRGSGKSFALALFLCDLAVREKQTILYTRFTLQSAHISIIPEFMEKLEIMGMVGEFEITKTEIIHKFTGSKILFRGIKTSAGNQTAALKSIQGVTTWVLDEAEELVDEPTFDKIDESVREKGVQNRVIIVLNPTHTSHWIYLRWFEKHQEDTCYIHTTYLQLSNLFRALLLGYWMKQKSWLMNLHSIRLTSRSGRKAYRTGLSLFLTRHIQVTGYISDGLRSIRKIPAIFIQPICRTLRIYPRASLRKPAQQNREIKLLMLIVSWVSG